MIVHKVRAPFLCREGQFTAGQRELCIGLDYQTIKKTEKFWCYLGKNFKTVYEFESAEVLKTGQQWKNPKGKVVIIVPLRIAIAKHSDWNEEEYNKKEAERDRINQERRSS